MSAGRASRLVCRMILPCTDTVALFRSLIYQSQSPAQSSHLVAQAGSPPARSLAFGRGQPIGPPGEQSGGTGPKVNLAKNTPAGALAAQLGTTDIPADVVATFGGLGFVWGHARAKLGKAALWGCTILIGGLVLLSKNGCVCTFLLPQPFECPYSCSVLMR